MSEQEKYRNTTGYAPSSSRSNTGEVTDEYRYVPRSRSTPVRGGAHSKSRRSTGNHTKSRSLNRVKEKERSRQSVQEARRRRQKELYTPSHLRKGRKIGAKELRGLLIPVIAAVAAVAISLLTVDRGSSYEFAQEGIQYYAGNAARVPAGTVVSLAEDKKKNESDTETGNGNGSFPIYLQDSSKMVIPKDMTYYEPRSLQYSRLVSMTEIEVEANGLVRAVRDGKTETPGKGFLYDGKDLYVFLEPVMVSFNGYTMELPALSYVEAVYGGYMTVFNYETKEFMMEACDGSGRAGPAGGDYEIALLGDSMTMRDGTRMLLATRPDLFEPVV